MKTTSKENASKRNNQKVGRVHTKANKKKQNESNEQEQNQSPKKTHAILENQKIQEQ